MIEVVIGLDGTISFVVREGYTFEAAKAEIQKATELLRLNGIEFEVVGEVEQHRHDHAHEHVQEHTHTH